MISEFFDRKIYLIVGQPGEEGKKIEGLRIIFEIDKTQESQPNNLKFSVYNLSKDTRSLCEQKGCQVQCFAGYGDYAKSIGLGDISIVHTVKQGPDNITTIEAADGLSNYQSKTVDKTFESGTSIGSILDSVLSAFGLQKGTVKGLDENKSVENGLTVSGMVKDVLTDILGGQGLNWSIQDGAVQITPKDEAISENVIILNKDTGLVGVPYKMSILNPEYVHADITKENGVVAISLLIPEIKVGSLFKLESEDVKGQYVARKFKHTGDNWSKNYYTQMELYDA